MLGLAGRVYYMSGDYKRGGDALDRGLRLLKQPIWSLLEDSGTCCLLANNQREAIANFERAKALTFDASFSYALSAVAYAELGHADKARSEIQSALRHRSELTLRDFRYYLLFRDEAQRERFSHVLVQAGLPE